MPLSFVSTSPTLESTLLDLIKPKMEVENSVLTSKNPVLNPSSTDVYSIEWEKGKSLNSLAREYLGNSFLWTVIADANNLDPLAPISLGSVVKVPTTAQIEKSVKKYLVDSPQGKQLITDAKQSILNLTGLSQNNSPVAKSLKECIDKVISFKTSQ